MDERINNKKEKPLKDFSKNAHTVRSTK